MGRKSVKENKNICQLSREGAGLTREGASEAIGFMSEDRIERVESGKSLAHPDEIMAMSEAYRDPLLCNRFCSGVCPIGKKYIARLESKSLGQITLESVAAINMLEKYKARMIEIAADGKLSEDELDDFGEILSLLRDISKASKQLEIIAETEK